MIENTKIILLSLLKFLKNRIIPPGMKKNKYGIVIHPENFIMFVIPLLIFVIKSSSVSKFALVTGSDW